MADRTTGELAAVQESPIGGLPAILDLYRDSLIPVEQQGEARKMTGGQFADFAREAAKQDVDRAVSAAEQAEASAGRAAQSESKAAASEAAAQAARTGAEAAQTAAQTAQSGAEQAKSSAAYHASAAADSALLAQSWAEGGTGVRSGEDTDNAEYWANRAQAYAEQTGTPAVVQGVYNYILTDRETGERYALLVEGGVLKLLGVSETLDAVEMTLVDAATGASYTLIAETGVLKLQEVD